ncbi:unnamed protein product [Lasius platythorax]|uniref:Uncharacterized protein n=1 Tax=Lasius platythorax TaxID=488582 RepID=A0AAV2N8Q1_9HYME
MKSNHVASDKSTRRATVGRSRWQFSIVLPVSRSITLFQSSTRAQSDERRSVRTSEGQCGIARQSASTRWTLHANSLVSPIQSALGVTFLDSHLPIHTLWIPVS